MERQTDYILGAKLTFENAKRLFKAAETLEGIKDYPTANSLLVLSAEEAVKAFSILNQGVFPEANKQGFEASFTDHKTKLKTIQSIRVITGIIHGFIDHWYKPMLENIDLANKEQTAHRKTTFNGLLNWIQNEAKIPDTPMAKERKWWDNAKTMKESGFYVGFNQGKWHLPNSITRSKYLSSKNYVYVFIGQMEFLIQFDFNSDVFKEYKRNFSNLLLK